MVLYIMFKFPIPKNNAFTVQSLYNIPKYNRELDYNTVPLWLLKFFTMTFYKGIIGKLEIVFMKHYAPNHLLVHKDDLTILFTR